MGEEAKMGEMTLSSRWADALDAWAIPEDILAAAPESPWGFPAGVFVEVARAALESPWTPTHERAAERVPVGGAVLDVGCGAGAASLPIAPPAGRIVAVDQGVEMLRAIADLGAGRADIVPVEGRWPDVADRVEAVDVVVCANVAYNVADLGGFVAALTDAARDRVVLELSDRHPQQPLAPLWEHFWGVTRPAGPTADDAVEVVREATGAAVSAERWTRARSFMGDRGPDSVAWIRRRLCLPADADAEVAEQLRRLHELAPSSMVTLWWPGRA
jgi:SAM-dependent methyltransferase